MNQGNMQQQRMNRDQGTKGQNMNKGSMNNSDQMQQ